MKIIFRDHKTANLLFQIVTDETLLVPKKDDAVYYKGEFFGSVTEVFVFFEDKNGIGRQSHTVHLKTVSPRTFVGTPEVGPMATEFLLNYDPFGFTTAKAVVTKFEKNGSPILWAIKSGTDTSMNKKNGLFQLEPRPSNREDDFDELYRFSSKDEAIKCYQKFYSEMPKNLTPSESQEWINKNVLKKSKK